MGPLRGSVVLPGDKSISHRAFLLNALGEGTALVSSSNRGLDLGSTREVLRKLGVVIKESGEHFTIEGRAGRFRPATDALNCGNSGTTMRLVAGLLSAQPFTSTLVGDESLSKRPMARIARPLTEMGARVEGPSGARTPPLIISGSKLQPVRFTLELASAQVKSCLLLAAAASRVEVEIEEPWPTRDHTERMLAAMGAQIETQGTRIHLRAAEGLRCVDVQVPGDPSAAALILATAMPVPGSEIQLGKMLCNPRRTAFLALYERMGVTVEAGAREPSAGEERGDFVATAPSSLRPIHVKAEEVPALIDEIPALAVLCAFAPGKSRLEGLGELRVKESNRLEAMVKLLRDFGVDATVDGDALEIVGGEVVAPGRYQPAKDHRMVMAAAALATGALARRDQGQCELMESEEVGVSDPQFFQTLSALSSSR
jgi:3-phosphoshikimate 1-carboxyvinyltransferase